VLAPTVLAQESGENAIAHLVHCSSGAIIFLSSTPFTIGRDPSNNLVLEDSLSSRNHARILQLTDHQGTIQYQIIDAGSSNGTFVSNQRLTPNQPCWLSPGNIIRIGTQEWKFEV
jgi:pSer/pThr/pTyr-binding forkhead associated (FHA) protein